jgi:hypothetical protein
MRIVRIIIDYDHQIEEEEMGGTCGTHGAQENTGFRWENRRRVVWEMVALFGP